MIRNLLMPYFFLHVHICDNLNYMICVVDKHIYKVHVVAKFILPAIHKNPRSKAIHKACSKEQGGHYPQVAHLSTDKSNIFCEDDFLKFPI